MDTAAIAAGPELDRLVAEQVMGWKPTTVRGILEGKPISTAPGAINNLDTYTTAPPAYSNDIELAWEVVAEMSRVSRWLVLEELPRGMGGTIWRASFGAGTICERATAAEAICAAALRGRRLDHPSA